METLSGGVSSSAFLVGQWSRTGNAGAFIVNVTGAAAQRSRYVLFTVIAGIDLHVHYED